MVGDDTLTEVRGLLIGQDKDEVQVVVWKRVEDPESGDKVVTNHVAPTEWGRSTIDTFVAGHGVALLTMMASDRVAQEPSARHKGPGSAGSGRLIESGVVSARVLLGD
jgi:hypothetical protein